LSKPAEYKVIGLMSGTSLDGLDIAFASFKYFNEDKAKWKFKILNSETVEYSMEWKKRLKDLHLANAMTFVRTDADLGKLFGTLTKKFIEKNKLKPDLISSHGHTVFHQPENGFTSQIGNGAQIAAITGVQTVCDFRTKDIALGGQGAPLVPIGDQLLFSEYDYCLNLGGIANISYSINNKRIAFDICPVNMALNFLASELNINYDKDGEIASGGSVNDSLLNKLNVIHYYKSLPPKSLGKEWFIKNFQPLIADTSISLNDRMRTVCEHIANQIANSLKVKNSEANSSDKKILITGGGTHNKFLIHCIEEYLKTFFSNKNVQIIIPSEEIIDFKEALIFAFLGLLRIRDEVNVLHSVTGAMKDHVGGTIYSAG
jgi:anhydro-N-acetylmuramic acid kinase